jgi:CopG antitoxin of type II toxin-antitoxin system
MEEQTETRIWKYMDLAKFLAVRRCQSQRGRRPKPSGDIFMNKKKTIERIPKEFSSHEEAAEFWDKHDTTDYPGAFRTVKVVSEFRNRHHEIPIDGDVVIRLQQRARKAGVPLGRLASELLRRELRAAA